LERWSTWWRTSDSAIARWLRAAREALLGEMPILAAGTALFAIIATVPALAAVVSIYGLASDPEEIRTHLKGLELVIPQEVVDFIGGQLERQAKRSHGALGLQIATSILLATISARSSARALIDALNRAYRVREVRSGLYKLGISLAMAFGTLVGLIVVFTIVVALPGIVAAAGLKGYHLVRILRWPLLLGMVFTTLGMMYRYAPSPRPLGTDRPTRLARRRDCDRATRARVVGALRVGRAGRHLRSVLRRVWQRDRDPTLVLSIDDDARDRRLRQRRARAALRCTRTRALLVLTTLRK
jgi:uncharacterized BrkB/YihY/UPF0761 family membrane protein